MTTFKLKLIIITLALSYFPTSANSQWFNSIDNQAQNGFYAQQQNQMIQQQYQQQLQQQMERQMERQMELQKQFNSQQNQNQLGTFPKLRTLGN